jgi:hypothetical protein
MTANDPLTGPFMTSTRITDSSNDEGYAILPGPGTTAPSLATQLREKAMNR